MIEIGDTVEVLFYIDDEIETYTIKPSVLIKKPTWTGSHEGKRDNYIEEWVTTADIHNNEISAHSHLAKALLGHRVGDSFYFYNDEHEKISGKIVGVEKNRL